MAHRPINIKGASPSNSLDFSLSFILAGNHFGLGYFASSRLSLSSPSLHTMTPPSPSRTDTSMLGKLLQGASLGRSTTATLSTDRKTTSYARGMDIFAPRVPQGRAVVRVDEEREPACDVRAPEFTKERRLEIQVRNGCRRSMFSGS